MNILWITNIVFPEAENLLKGEGTLKSTGGWMLGAAEALIKNDNIKLFVASVSKDVKEITYLKGKSIGYYLIPFGKGNLRVNHDYEPLWKVVRDSVKPDVVHIHGTEYSHGLAYIEACGSNNVCVSIQGLLSAYYYYYYHGLTVLEIIKSMTPLSLIRGGILKGYINFKRRGEIEKKILRKVHHIIGRTSWDRERIWAINPDAKYHYGGEILRSDFYIEPIWNYYKCTPHSIFLSQATYPIKGLHMLLRAMPLVLRHFPDATVRIAGTDIARSKGGKELIKLSNYGLIIRKQIKKYHLEKCVTFTGALDGNGMRKEYLRSNVFVCPSSIENSPNSLGEAQLLGVPVVASYTGGIPDMMKGDEKNLYRFEEIEMLACKIVDIFMKAGGVKTDYMRKEALIRHDPIKNTESLINIYKMIIESRACFE